MTKAKPARHFLDPNQVSSLLAQNFRPIPKFPDYVINPAGDVFRITLPFNARRYYPAQMTRINVAPNRPNPIWAYKLSPGAVLTTEKKLVRETFGTPGKETHDPE